MPVWVFPCSNDGVLVEVVLIGDGFVFRFVLIQAVCDVDLDLRDELLDGRLDS